MQTVQQQLHEMSRVIGGLQTAVVVMTDLWKSQETAATAGRALVHQKIDTLRGDVTQLTARVKQISEDVALMQPAVQSIKDDRLRAEGARKLGSRLWAAMAAAAGALGWGAHELFGYLGHRPPGS